MIARNTKQKKNPADADAVKHAQLEYFKNSLEHHEHLSAAVVAFGQSLLRGALILNGGAVIALLSIYGALTDKPSVQVPVAIWSLGVFLAALAAYFAAKSQREFQVAASDRSLYLAKKFFDLEISRGEKAEIDSATWGRTLRDWFWGVWLGSIAAFLIGALTAVCALR